MEHIVQHDWNSSERDIYFVNEADLDNCVVERILRNKFREPCYASDLEEEVRPTKIDWSQIFKRNKNEDRLHRIYVAGLRALPAFPKLSALTVQQHYHCLKVLCTKYPNVLVCDFMPRATKQDYRIFEEVKETYAKEQVEYLEWAKTLWTTSQCIRALRPKPIVEMVYEAQFKMRAHEMQSLPKHYEMAAQIHFSDKSYECDMLFQKELISINARELPHVHLPELIAMKFSIMKPSPVPEPCKKHPCRFILPTEKSVTELPLSEVYRELAQFALDNGAQSVASEAALACLMEHDRDWAVPLSVCRVLGVDGDQSNVLVLGNEFFVHRECAQTRTYRAFKHLLVDTFIPATEKANIKARAKDRCSSTQENEVVNIAGLFGAGAGGDETSDEEDNLFIDAAECPQSGPESDKMEIVDNIDDEAKGAEKSSTKENDVKTRRERSAGDGRNEFYSCTCQDSLFDRPSPRSFRKWQTRCGSSAEQHDIIVHCSHKARGDSGEVIMEPLPEYQIDLAGSAQSHHKVRSLALSLLLRRNASLLNVRVDGQSGDVVTIDNVYMEEYVKQHESVLRDVANVVHTTLSRLQGLVPGNYILQHELRHGANAMLYVSRACGGDGGHTLSLEFECAQLADADEAIGVKTPPTLAPVLLPAHKFRKILPCAFTPFENQLPKEPKKPATRQKAPPQALKWPRKKKKKPKQ